MIRPTLNARTVLWIGLAVILIRMLLAYLMKFGPRLGRVAPVRAA